MHYKSILIFVLFSVVIISIFLIIKGINYSPPLGEVYIEPGDGKTNPICQQEKVSCNTDADCSKCVDNEEMKCVEIKRSSEQEKKYGKSGKYCLPAKPKTGCNEKNGGIWTWTGWSSDNRMEWDCLCTYPQIAGGAGCQELNANVCSGGTWNYDARTATSAPTVKNCTCPKGTQLLATKPNNVPICVPASKFLCESKEMCETMYSDSTYIK